MPGRDPAYQRTAAEVAERTIVGEMLLIPIRHSTNEGATVLTLNEVGSHVWSRLRAPVVLSELVASVTAEFEVSEEKASGDLIPFLDRLENLGLIREVQGGVP